MESTGTSGSGLSKLDFRWSAMAYGVAVDGGLSWTVNGWSRVSQQLCSNADQGVSMSSSNVLSGAGLGFSLRASNEERGASRLNKSIVMGGGAKVFDADALIGSSMTVEGAVEAEETFRECEKRESESSELEEEEEVLKERRGWLTGTLK